MVKMKMVGQLTGRKWSALIRASLFLVFICASGANSFSYDNENDRRELALDCERVINFYRYFHDTMPLKHSDDLEVYAMKRVKEMTKEQMGPNGTPPHGETSIYSKYTPKDKDCSRFMYPFYLGYYKYIYDKPESQSEMNHFTQIIWNSTTNIGCATERQFFFCAYDPVGNMKGEIKPNVAMRNPNSITPKPGPGPEPEPTPYPGEWPDEPGPTKRPWHWPWQTPWLWPWPFNQIPQIP